MRGAPLLVLGRSGQVARALVAACETQGRPVVAAGRETLDLRDPTADIAGLIAASGARAVVNASGYTAVDAAEADRDTAMRLNGEAPGRIARACGEAGVACVHLSTDYVFDGAGGAPYVEETTTNPLNVYGETKLAGERAVLAACGGAAVVRTSWVYDAAGHNFVRTMLRLSATQAEVAVVDDQRGRPTFADDIAAGVLAVVDARAGGLLHLAGGGEATWAEFASAVFEEAGRPTRVRRIATHERRAPARRPADSRLDCTRIAATLGVRPPHWRESLARCLHEMETAVA